MIFYATILCALLGVIGAIAVKLYIKLSAGVCTSRRRIDGKVVIITGATAGIGLETAIELSRRGGRIILACRNVEKAQDICDYLKKTTNNNNIKVRELDLSSLKSVRDFANLILETESRLDILINNAGVAGLKRRITEDGLESQFCTNYFGPFLLTNMLIPLMEKTGSARIINVSSIAHYTGTDLDLNNLNAEKKWVGKKIYPWNKLCQVLFTKELHYRLRQVDSTITVNALHPGISRTNIFNTSKRVVGLWMNCFWWLHLTPWEAAQTSIFLAVSEEVEDVSGYYWQDCKKTRPAPLVRNRQLAQQLWEESAKHVKLQPDEYHLNLVGPLNSAKEDSDEKISVGRRRAKLILNLIF